MEITLKTVLIAAVLMVALNAFWLQWMLPAVTLQPAPTFDVGAFVLSLITNAILLPALVWVAAWVQKEFK